MSELTFLSSTHQYYLDGRELICPSKVFELVGITDYSRVPFYRLEPARVKGDYVHQMAALYGVQRLLEEAIEPCYSGYLPAIKKFYKERVKKIVAIEQPVWDAELGYAGTPDIVYFDFDNALCVDDFKTPVKVHIATKWQTAFYQNGFQKLKKMKVDKRAGIQLREDGEYVPFPYTDYRRDFNEAIVLLKAAFLKQQYKIN